jgi:predicted trehalose synthase
VSEGHADRQEIVAALNAELDRISHRLDELHRQLMGMPTDERRLHWVEYFRILSSLMQRQQEIEKARAAAVDPEPNESAQQRAPSLANANDANIGARRRTELREEFRGS